MSGVLFLFLGPTIKDLPLSIEIFGKFRPENAEHDGFIGRLSVSVCFIDCGYAAVDLLHPNKEKFADICGIFDGIMRNKDSLSRGRTGHHYKDAIAFKFDDDLHETTLRGIEGTPSRSGELSPVALFDTVEIDGCDVTRTSPHNLTSM